MRYEITLKTNRSDSVVGTSSISCANFQEIKIVLRWAEDAFEQIEVYDREERHMIYFKDVSLELVNHTRDIAGTFSMIQYEIKKLREEQENVGE